MLSVVQDEGPVALETLGAFYDVAHWRGEIMPSNVAQCSVCEAKLGRRNRFGKCRRCRGHARAATHCGGCGKARDAGFIDGRCFDCRKAYMDAWRERNLPKKVKPIDPPCSKCGAPRDDTFDKNRCGACRRARVKAWAETNATRLGAAAALWRVANKGKIMANAQRRLSESPAARESSRLATKKWALDNPEKKKEGARVSRQKRRAKARIENSRWSMRNRVKVRAYEARWRAANPEKYREIGRRRRALEHGAPGRFTDADVRRILEEQGCRCFYCKKVLDKYHVDHKHPLVHGGSNMPENICCACPRCNLRKRDRTAEEFFEVLRLEAL